MPGLVSRDVPASLYYMSHTDDGKPPYNLTYTPPEGVPTTNVVTEQYPVTIHDARGKEDSFSLDKTGFAFTYAPSKEKEFTDEDAITTGYYKEVEELLKTYTGGKRVFIFDHTIRRPPTNEPVNPAKPRRSPVERVHVDQTFESALTRVKDHLGADADRLLKSRVRIINVWRPIANVVAHHPLAVADYYSLDQKRDLVSSAHIGLTRTGATFSVRHNPDHKWYYLSDQTPDEVTFIKCFDSDEDKARLTPHTAFADKTSPPEAPQRQSIEVRCLVFDQE